jgi:glutamate-1-semialdehyde 2,1-aminomutase
VFFTDQPVVDAASARTASTRRFASFYHALLEGGVYLPPSQFEAAFVSVAHSDEDVEKTLSVAGKAFAAAARA